jgi:threonine synthase
MPRVVAGSSFNKNPIVRAFLTDASSCMDLPQEKIRETAVNEPLINWHSIDGDHALDAIRETNGWAGHTSDKSMLALSRVLREREGLNVLPAATAGLHVLLEAHKRHTLPGDRYVVILTGRKA